MYYTDYHTHTQLSPDSSAPLSAMAEAAAAAGLSELCVTDHYDLVDIHGAPNWEPLDWAAALEQWEPVRDAFRGRLSLKLGVELGSAPFYPEEAARALDCPAVDFVIGSLHNLTARAGGSDFYYVDYRSPADCYAALDDYFASMARLAPLPLYDSLGHIIYPLRYMTMRDGQPVSLDRYTEQLRAILRDAAETGHAVELNTYNGRTVADWAPVLRLYREVGGELVTVGSDAHVPGNVAQGVREAYDLLSALGFRYVTTYEKRQPRPLPL